MSDNKQQFWTVTVSLLIASALISACGTSSGKDITPGPTLTAATLATPTPEPIAAASPVPPPSPGPEIAFPLALGNTWVYQFTRYEGGPITEIITTTRIITETVVEVKDVSSYLVAKVHQEKSAEVPVGEVPPSWKGAPLEPATSTYYWLVVSGNRLYRQEGNLDLSNLSTALVEFVFPVKLGEKWYRSDEKARFNPTYADDWMLRKVTKMGTVVVPAGEFNDCFFLEEEWAGTTFETWFCPKVGIVSEKGDHHGTPYGFRKVLIQYQLNNGQAVSDPHKMPYLGLAELVPPDKVRERCEGEIRIIQEYGKTIYAVTCDDAQIRVSYTSSLVGDPHAGYAAYADVLSPHVTIWYSMWLYDNPAQAAMAKLRWENLVRYYLDPASYHVIPEPDGFVATAKEKGFGLPYWKRVIQKGNRLAVIEVEAMPAPLTLEDIKQFPGKKPGDLTLQPEGEAAAKALFEKASRVIGERFFEAK